MITGGFDRYGQFDCRFIKKLSLDLETEQKKHQAIFFAAMVNMWLSTQNITFIRAIKYYSDD